MTKRWELGLVVSLLAAGCAGPFINVAPSPPAGSATTREGRGSACGVNLMGVIPIAVNGRAARAYSQAVEDAGASGLADTRITDRWYWVFIGDMFCTDVAGIGYRLTGVPAAAP